MGSQDLSSAPPLGDDETLLSLSQDTIRQGTPVRPTPSPITPPAVPAYGYPSAKAINNAEEHPEQRVTAGKSFSTHAQMPRPLTRFKILIMSLENLESRIATKTNAVLNNIKGGEKTFGDGM